jgi:hypothetical protein
MVIASVLGCWNEGNNAEARTYLQCDIEMLSGQCTILLDRCFAGRIDPIEIQEDGDNAWCAASFPSLTAAEACAGSLQGAPRSVTLMVCTFALTR